MHPLHAIRPIDCRYNGKTKEVSEYYSEYALIRYRVLVEVRYLQALHQLGLPQLQHFSAVQMNDLNQMVDNFNEADAEEIKTTERTTNHDVKAVEYFVKARMEEAGMEKILEFVHFGLTSQDINNTAIPLSIKDSLNEVIYPALEGLTSMVERYAMAWAEVPMLAKTHGQPASPTLLGIEFSDWTHRPRELMQQIQPFYLPPIFV